MPTQITGKLGSPKPDGALLPLANGTIYLSPSDETQLRIQYGGAGAFQLVTANTALPVPYQYGLSTLTDSLGVYDLSMPKASEIHTPTPAGFLWNITLPDGQVYSGPPLSGSGPYSLDDLLTTYGWELSSSLRVRTGVLGQTALGTVTATAQDSIDVVFQTPMGSAIYQVVCSPGQDTTGGSGATNAVPIYNITNKTGQGFTINLSFPFTGTVDFIAWNA